MIIVSKISSSPIIEGVRAVVAKESHGVTGGAGLDQDGVGGGVVGTVRTYVEQDLLAAKCLRVEYNEGVDNEGTA